MIDFTRNFFLPISQDQHAAVSERLAHFMPINGPVMGPADLAKVLDDDDSDAKAVLQKINARKVLSTEMGSSGLNSESVNGYTLILEKGRLGMKKEIGVA